MKKRLTILLAAALLCTGCANKTSSENLDSLKSADSATSATSGTTAPEIPAADSETSGTSSAETENPASSEAPSDSTGKAGGLFKYGVWRTDSAYFIFNEEGGRTVEFELGIGIPFRVEPVESGSNEVVFHMAAEDNNTVFRFSVADEDNITLSLDDSSFTLVYLPGVDADNFIFAGDERLRLLALAYFYDHTGYAPTCADVTSNPDGTATVHLYDTFEDHTATSAWYTIDRITLQGTDDITGEPIDFSGVDTSAVEAMENAAG